MGDGHSIEKNTLLISFKLFKAAIYYASALKIQVWQVQVQS